MSNVKMKITFEVLFQTACEKINVLGKEDASEEVNGIISLMNDLIVFWDDIYNNDTLIELQAYVKELTDILTCEMIV